MICEHKKLSCFNVTLGPDHAYRIWTCDACGKRVKETNLSLRRWVVLFFFLCFVAGVFLWLEVLR